MAKGDDSRSRNMIDEESNYSKNQINNQRTRGLDQFGKFSNAADTSRDLAFKDYGNIMGQYQDFAKTGGISPMDASNLRSRALSPIRSVYAGANREVDRSRALQGGYSPGFGVLKSRMARDMSSGISDAATNAEASLAEMRRSGQLAGLSGMSQLYGTSPGMASTFGNQQLQSFGQLNDIEGMDLNRGQGRVNAMLNASKIPGKWENTMGRINDIFDLGSKFVQPWADIGGAPKARAMGDTIYGTGI